MRRERLRLRIIGLRAVERKKEEAGSSESSEMIGGFHEEQEAPK